MTTHDDKAREREQFEAWLRTERSVSDIALHTNDDGSYKVAQVNDKWKAWQAAWNRRTALSPASGQEAKPVAAMITWAQLGTEKPDPTFVPYDEVPEIRLGISAVTPLFAAPAQQVEAEKWISVETAMPNTQQRVLIAYTTSHGKRAVTLGWYCKAKTVESADCEGEVDDEYDEEKDTYYMKEQWVDESHESEYHYPIRNVTHWMPLPDLPAAGSNNGGKG